MANLSTYLSQQRISPGDLNKDGIVNALIDAYDSRIGNAPCVEIYASVAQSLATGAWTTIAYDSERIDTTGMHDTVTINSRITIKTAGRYVGFVQLGFMNSAGGAVRAGRVILNGSTTTIVGSSQLPHVGSGFYSVIPVLIMPRLYAAGDYLQVQALQDSGGALNSLLDATNGYYNEAALWQI